MENGQIGETVDMKKNYLIIEHRHPAYEERLRNEIKGLNEQVKALRAELDRLTMMYGAEVHYNGLLCDLLRLNGIPFRHVFDHDVRYRK